MHVACPLNKNPTLNHIMNATNEPTKNSTSKPHIELHHCYPRQEPT
jgi:hypothetical protein